MKRKPYRPSLGEALVIIRAQEFLLGVDGDYARALADCRTCLSVVHKDARKVAFLSRVYRKLAAMRDASVGAKYEVIVGNVGTVYSGPDKAEALTAYDTYREQSRQDYGRSAGEDVTVFEDGDILREFAGSLHAEDL